jgi:hypothetical protein
VNVMRSILLNHWYHPADSSRSISDCSMSPSPLSTGTVRMKIRWLEATVQGPNWQLGH